MQRAVLVALLVTLGCSAVLAVSPPCAPQKFTTGINVLVSGVYGAQETAVMAVDFDINAAYINISAGVTGSNEPFVGTYLYVNNTGYWLQQGQCFPTNLTAFGPVQCLQPNGNYSNIVVAGVNATQYTIINPSNSSSYIYTSDIYMIPIAYQEFDWGDSDAPANSTGMVYNNPSYEVDPNLFVVPAICANGPTGKHMLHEETHIGRIIKKMARLA